MPVIDLVACRADDASSAWQATAASVRGKSHVDGDLPNQDSVVIERVAEADAWIAVVSDGAGTAARAQDGARETTRAIYEGLRQYARTHRGLGADLAQFRAAIEESVERLRSRLEATGSPLFDFHCTFVACIVAGPASGIALIGDSVALTTRFALLRRGGAQPQVDFFPDADCVLHEPERGEYANETHFLTEPDWREHLRIAPLPTQSDAVILMSDGAMDVAMSRKKVFRGFLSNLVGRLAVTSARAERDATVDAWLSDPQTFGITGDDKTLVVLLRNDSRALAKLPLFLGQDSPASMASEKTLPPRDDAGLALDASASAVPASAPVPRVPLSSALLLGVSALMLAAAAGIAYAVWVGEGSGETHAGRAERTTWAASSSVSQTAASASRGPAASTAASAAAGMDTGAASGGIASAPVAQIPASVAAVPASASGATIPAQEASAPVRTDVPVPNTSAKTRKPGATRKDAQK